MQIWPWDQTIFHCLHHILHWTTNRAHEAFLEEFLQRVKIKQSVQINLFSQSGFSEKNESILELVDRSFSYYFNLVNRIHDTKYNHGRHFLFIIKTIKLSVISQKNNFKRTIWSKIFRSYNRNRVCVVASLFDSASDCDVSGSMLRQTIQSNYSIIIRCTQ